MKPSSFNRQLLLWALLLLSTPLFAQQEKRAIDPQVIHDQDAMTWTDYKPIPGHNWADPTLKPARSMKIALVAIDFPDQPFVVTLPKHSDPFGNPGGKSLC